LRFGDKLQVWDRRFRSKKWAKSGVSSEIPDKTLLKYKEMGKNL
jgi:hypothetical protein